MNDSKKLTDKKRQELYTQIIDLAVEWKLYFWVWVVDNFVIDSINIRQANREAMRRALVEVQRKIPKELSEISVVIDGRDNYVFDELEQKIKKAIDSKVEKTADTFYTQEVFQSTQEEGEEKKEKKSLVRVVHGHTWLVR